MMVFNTDEIQSFAKEFYNIDVLVTPLTGYDEDNFLLTSHSGKKYILKVSSGIRPSFLEAQVSISQHLSKSEISSFFQHHIANKHDQYITIYTDKNSQHTYCIRLLTYLEGTLWKDLNVWSDELYIDLGSFLGKLDAISKDIYLDAANRAYVWDISRAEEAIKNLHHIKDPAKRRLADYFLLQFETEVKPKIASLRHACIHNDANDSNILVKEGKVTGLIDFGDMVWAPLIHNLAIACTYAIMYSDEPVEASAIIVNSYHKEYSLMQEETDILYYLIAARLCISVTQSAAKADNGLFNVHHYQSEQSAWKLLEYWLTINPLKAAHTYRLACDQEPAIQPIDKQSQLKLTRRNIIGRNLSLSYHEPLTIIKGALQYLYDDLGNTYLDCVNNVSHVGHCHPVVVRAMQKQLATLNTNTRYLHEAMTSYAKELLATLPSNLKVCYFVNSGSEANDLAARMSRHYTGRNDIIVLEHAYHGTSSLDMDMSPYKFDNTGGSGQKPFIHKAPVPDDYRGIYQGKDAGKQYAQEVLRILENLQEAGKAPAAFICETLLGVGGQMPLPDDYLQYVYRYVRQYGGVCIADEVQVGFGRTGHTFWGFQLQEAEPDIVVLGKPIGNGHPLAAVVVTEAIADAFNNGLEYFNTYGGNPVSMVTGLTVLNVIRDEALQENAVTTGAILLEGFKKLQDNYECIGDVRGKGLFIGVEFVKDRITKEPDAILADYIVESMKNQGILLSTDGPYHNVLKIKPPMVITEDNCMKIVETIESILK